MVIMQTLSQKFLTPAEQDKITALVQQVEQETSGEIVPMVVSASHSYPVAMIYGASVLALPLALLLMPLIGGLFWMGSQNVWIFLVLFILLYGLFYGLLQRCSWLKRLFLSQKQIDAEVEEAAITAFFTEKLHKTREANGILLFISLIERKVWVLGDSGINDRIDPAQWQGIVTLITDGIKEKRQCEAICTAIAETGKILKTHFPARKDDSNELHNLILR
jgi:putative membrane protein